MILPIVGEQSFMLADGDEHLRGRAMITQAFSAAATVKHEAMVRDIAEREVATWPRDAAIALHGRLRALTLRVILATLFGPDVDAVPSLHARLLDMLEITSGVELPLPTMRRLPVSRRRWRDFVECRAEVDVALAWLLESRRATTYFGDDLLGSLLAARRREDAGQPAARLRDTLMSLILAGHETTAGELAWALHLLAHHPEARRALVSDLATGASDYLVATTEEVLRHRPVFVFAIPRAVAAPVAVDSWHYRAPAHVVACIYLMHHDPDVFSHPDRFLPERFIGSRPPAAWIPWGGGRRRCPGRRFAMLELQTVLRAVLTQVEVQPAGAPERPRWRSVIVTPHAGSRVILAARSGPGGYPRASSCGR